MQQPNELTEPSKMFLVVYSHYRDDSELPVGIYNSIDAAEQAITNHVARMHPVVQWFDLDHYNVYHFDTNGPIDLNYSRGKDSDMHYAEWSSLSCFNAARLQHATTK